MTQVSEDDLIARFFAPLAGPAALELRDDAGLLGVSAGQELVLTKDALVAGVHFFADDPPASIARKALRVNLSDLAAKRSRPVGFLLGLVLPADWTADWLQAFAEGLGEDAAKFACPLIGGDTVSTPGPLCLSITALGEVPAAAMLRRTTARPGDIIYCSGTIGDAALGLRLRQSTGSDWTSSATGADRAHLLDRYLHPQPRLGLRTALLAAHAGMDVSDGLVGDLTKMMRGSGVSARLDLGRLPLSSAAKAALRIDADLLETIATGGDDYEIIATVPPVAAKGFEGAAGRAGILVTAIGEVLDGSDPLDIVGPDGSTITFAKGSYSHY
ncbi:thiamine-phosphate kinase [Lichenihabitans psoromatis]|uniref:thiamine-phosphate kinase n=1 Tax=Lichenihabitans psoromatis TaxID=2528642 RepID=UPI001035917E|nr:thiamine-phosphate kinase [Lichenihabitans psoromatis]